MKTEINNITEALNKYTTTLTADQNSKFRPALEVVSRDLNKVAFTSDVILCAMSDLNNLNDERITAVFKKYGLEVQKSDEFHKVYATIQALVEKANGQKA